MPSRSPASNDAAPAYDDDFFIDHERPGNMISGYALVPQGESVTGNNNNTNTRIPENDDIEQQQFQHNHNHNNNRSQSPFPHQPSAASIALDSNDLPVPAAHVHCDACERLLERKERRNNERHCCTMVAVTFIVAFACLSLLGIVIVARVARK